MIISNQKQWQRQRRNTICYLCGRELVNDCDNNDDHCPPIKIFNKVDRANYPIILTVHRVCNQSWALDDNRFAVIWSKISKNPSNYFNPGGVVKSEPVGSLSNVSLLHNVPFEKLIYRILRMSHYVFYNEFLSEGTKVSFQLPFNRFDKNYTPLDQGVELFYGLSSQLIYSQSVNMVNGIVAYNSKFKFVTTWDNLDDGRDICIFAIDINEIKNLKPFFNDERINVIIGFYEWERPLTGLKAGKNILHYTRELIKNPILI